MLGRALLQRSAGHSVWPVGQAAAAEAAVAVVFASACSAVAEAVAPAAAGPGFAVAEAAAAAGFSAATADFSVAVLSLEPRVADPLMNWS